MPLIPVVTRAHASAERSEPNTVLGFFFKIVAAVIAAAVTVSVVMVVKGQVIAAGAVCGGALLTAVGVMRWVARTHRRNPTALMLGQVTARDFLEVQQWAAGDSVRGLRTETLIPLPHELDPGEPPALGAGSSSVETEEALDEDA